MPPCIGPPSSPPWLWPVEPLALADELLTRNADAPASSVSFRRLDTGSTPGRFVSGIAVDPSDARHAWISYSGYGAYTPESAGHVFDVRYHPSTAKATWTDITGNLGDQPVTGVAVNAETGDLYAGTDFGVLRLPHGSSSWEEAAPGMPHVAVYGLTVSQSGHLLYAATHGRGAYRLALPVKPATPPGGGTGGGTTPPPATADKVRPTLTVSKIKTVRRPKRTTIKGRARDASKIRRVTLRFGDGKRKRSVRLTRSGRFTVRHRYGKPARYEVTVTATDRAGNSRTRHRTARVLARRS